MTTTSTLNKFSDPVHNLTICETKSIKTCKNSSYNYFFRKDTGFFQRWGTTLKDDPSHSIFGPEIADIEISTAEKDHFITPNGWLETPGGCPGFGCKNVCYKSNAVGTKSIHMPLDTLKLLLSKITQIPTLCQIAYGILSIHSHPQMWDIFRHTRSIGLIPNFTFNGGDSLTDEDAQNIRSLCGAVSVSVNKVNKQQAFDNIEKLTKLGMSQVNIHYVLSDKSYNGAFQLVNEIISDRRLSKLNALVFLMFKETGCGIGHYSPIRDVDQFKQLVEHCRNKKINFGMDSCSAPIFEKAIEGDSLEENMKQTSERCESTCFSCYINAFARAFPCSFTEQTKKYNGVDVLGCKNFLKDVWFSDEFVGFRRRLLKNHRECPDFDLSCEECECVGNNLKLA